MEENEKTDGGRNIVKRYKTQKDMAIPTELA